ncbi:carboxymuconolactone decarboxylase family protein [Cohnella fermenti]|uniref:Alkylhydroperoxidase n=1 Tax=Cohnella fermenti TaxID=2565925 RepID=A0A4S4C3B0_9BACL|nr:carboxymuconolactone decarboxylase family protein [Cohnella fermenti]THF82218.1 alkylhydroperoxidase [Cohnella fermenti]
MSETASQPQTSQTNASLYARHSPSFSAKLFPFAPEGFKAFGEFNVKALAAGALSVKTKELIAVAVAHITGCPYCIEAHVGKSKAEQASFEEIFEAVTVAAAVKAHSAFFNATNALRVYEGSQQPDLVPLANIELAEKLEDVNEDLYSSFHEFLHKSLVGGRLSAKEKLLIAVGSALVEGSAYSIEVFTRRAKEEGISIEELAETTLVATVLKAGSAMAHRVNALQAFERE